MTYLANASSSPLVPGTSMGNMQGITSGTGTSLIRMPDGSVRRVGVNNIPEDATPLSVDGRKINIAGENSGMPELVEQGGVMVAKDRATGLARPFASTADWLSGNYFDFDRQGSGTGVAHPHTGAGEIAKDFEKGPDGKLKKVVPKDTKSEFEKTMGMTMKDWMKENEAMQTRIGERKFKQEQMARLPDLAHAAGGGSYATALTAGLSGLESTATATSGMKPYSFGAAQLPTRMNFASLLG